MPHHCVFKNSTITALRVVYNASQKTANGKSLNEQLAIGRSKQSEMVSLLLNFRLYRYVFTADVEKMYKQIMLSEDQYDLHRFVYRFDKNGPMRDFRLKTVTFGTANAPYLAIRTLAELALSVEKTHPLAFHFIKKSMYMDDVMGGCHSLDEMYRAYKQLKEVFASAKFNLRKWCSNTPEFLDRIPSIECEQKALSEDVGALGVNWSQTNDEFSYDISVPIETIPSTKRQLTSEISMLYDPLGWLSPLVLKSKYILQKLWLERIDDWDKPIDSKFVVPWLNIKREFYRLNDFRIPRWINYRPNDVIELHGFCDASEIGYAAAIYFRNVTDGTTCLLMAKSRVAPTKKTNNDENVTIPRLELCGALLLAELMKKVIDAIPLSFERTVYWTDAKIVLGWINGKSERYKKFIATRIAKIQKLSDKMNWYHVASEHNSADCASRGLSPSELVDKRMWWYGPEFLSNGNFKLSKNDVVFADVEQEVESISISASVATVPLKTTTRFESALSKCDSFDKLKSIVAIEARSNQNNNDILTTDELMEAYREIIRTMQHESFAQEMHVLKQEKSLQKSSPIIKLNPFLDDHGILRVGGRLSRADISFDAKHQVLISSKHPITRLIIKHFHEKCMHGGPKLTEFVLRQNFWRP